MENYDMVEYRHIQALNALRLAASVHDRDRVERIVSTLRSSVEDLRTKAIGDTEDAQEAKIIREQNQ